MALKENIEVVKNHLSESLISELKDNLNNNLQAILNNAIEEELAKKLSFLLSSGLEEDLKNRISHEIKDEFKKDVSKIVHVLLIDKLESRINEKLELELPKKMMDFIFSFFPFGVLWNRESDTLFHAIIAGLTPEFVRMEKYRKQFKKEIVPKTAWYLLPEWEQLLDIHNTKGMSVEERQNLAGLKYHSRGSLSRPYYEELAERLGYKIKISTFEITTVSNFKLGKKFYTKDWDNLIKIKILESSFSESNLKESLLVKLFKEKKHFSSDLLFIDKKDNFICLG